MRRETNFSDYRVEAIMLWGGRELHCGSPASGNLLETHAVADNPQNQTISFFCFGFPRNVRFFCGFIFVYDLVFDFAAPYFARAAEDDSFSHLYFFSESGGRIFKFFTSRPSNKC